MTKANIIQAISFAFTNVVMNNYKISHEVNHPKPTVFLLLLTTP